MHATHHVLAHEKFPAYAQTVAAVVYANDAYPEAIFNSLVSRCREAGLSLAGALQHRALDGAGQRCDVLLEDLACGRRIPLLAHRGAGAKGCRLDESALAEATAAIEASLERRPELLVLSKFGKVECEGGGFRDLIARAVSCEIPVIIGVPRRNLDAWRLFAGEFAVELDVNACEVERWLVETTIRPELFTTE